MNAPAAPRPGAIGEDSAGGRQSISYKAPQLAYPKKSHRQKGALRRLLEAPEDDLAHAAQARIEQLRDSHRRVRALEERLALALADALAARGEPLSDLHVEDADGGFLQRLAARFEKHAAAGTALLTAAGAKGAFFAIVAGSASGLDVSAFGTQVAAILGGRVGGSGRLFQGKAGDLTRRDEALAALAAALEARKDGQA